MERQLFISRILISLVTAMSFVAMALSGVAAFIVPQGRVAYWTTWTFLGLSKTQWGNIHITTSVLFLIAAIWHICYNWTPLMQYLRGIPGRMSTGWRDLAIASLLTLFFTVGAVTKTPPLNYILDFNTWIKESWVRTPADDPPFGHAELLSLKGFCRKMYINLDDALRELRQAGLNIADENVTLERMARDNGTTPAKIYQIIKKLEHSESSDLHPATKPAPPASSQPASEAVPWETSVVREKPPVAGQSSATTVRYTDDLVVERFEGKGIGRKTLAAICQELKLDKARIEQKLAAKQIVAKGDETLKDVATRHGIVPIELLKTILVGEQVRE